MKLRSWSLLTNVPVWFEKNFSKQQLLILISAGVGLLSGLVAVLLKNLTYLIQSLLGGGYISNYHNAFYFIFPLIGLLLVYLFSKFILKKEIGQGITTTLYSISRRKGFMRRFQNYASLITAPITLGFGGSAGLEAPTVVSSAALSTSFSKFLNLTQASRTLLIGCAAAGAMSSIFQAPIAGIIFAIEIFSLDLTLASMIPLLVASVSSILTSYFFFGPDIILHTQLGEAFEISDVPLYIALGIFTAIASITFTKVYIYIFKKFKAFKSKFNKILVGGIILSGILFLVPQIYGEGYSTVNELLAGNHELVTKNKFLQDWSTTWMVILFLLLLVIFKMIATSVTIAAGGIGGIFAPVLFIGSMIGHCYGLVINALGITKLPVSVNQYTLVGMAGLMAGVMHAPLTAIFLIAEITSGYSLFVPLMITAAISYVITSQFQPNSVYTMELAERGDLVTHNKDQAVLTLMDIHQVIEDNFQVLTIDMNLEQIINEGVIKSKRNIFPVVDENNLFKGIILLDGIRSIMFDKSLYQEMTVIDLMQNAPDVIELNECKMKDIMKKFQETDAWNLPVVREGKYVGFISKSKLLTAYRQKLIEVTV
ncbi:chloride channel protein [Psychroflexus sediminis]|uniref:Chloride channel protein, CIC family n=1 Tax=Psychroflexus sediminis TaxID=470826 RepID=A0A1G7UPG0_9FLAO|nr:chloride channel protein [Psychroflexus sediminis]SDG49452.1 chloride channel protein, CIC family [Psychroflexus sediminis]